MSTQSPRTPATNMPPPIPSTTLERDATNFDFRVVTLLSVLITRPDLLKEYLDDGKAKIGSVPLALHERTKWKALRMLFDPNMLAGMLYLFENLETQASTRHLLRVFHTMTNLEEYSLKGCPNAAIIREMVAYSRQQTANLDPAGVAADPAEEN